MYCNNWEKVFSNLTFYELTYLLGKEGSKLTKETKRSVQGYSFSVILFLPIAQVFSQEHYQTILAMSPSLDLFSSSSFKNWGKFDGLNVHDFLWDASVSSLLTYSQPFALYGHATCGQANIEYFKKGGIRPTHRNWNKATIFMAPFSLPHGCKAIT